MEKKWTTSVNNEGKIYKETLVCDNSLDYPNALIEFLGKCDKYSDKCTHIELSIVNDLVDQPDVSNNTVAEKLDQVLDILGGSPVIPVNFRTTKKVHKKYLDYRFNEMLYQIQELRDDLDARYAMADNINTVTDEDDESCDECNECQKQYTYSGDPEDEASKDSGYDFENIHEDIYHLISRCNSIEDRIDRNSEEMAKNSDLKTIGNELRDVNMRLDKNEGILGDTNRMVTTMFDKVVHSEKPKRSRKPATAKTEADNNEGSST